MEKFRKMFVRKNAMWVEIFFGAISPGDIYILIEPDGRLVKNENGICIFRALDYPIDLWGGNYSVKTESLF